MEINFIRLGGSFWSLYKNYNEAKVQRVTLSMSLLWGRPKVLQARQVSGKMDPEERGPS